MSPALPRTQQRRVLLAVHGCHEELRAGFGQAAIAVRTLDGVSLAVHAGELLIVRGGVASGAVSLVNALAGMPRPVGHGPGCVHHAAPGVQIRRASITRSAFDAMISEWSACTSSAQSENQHAARGTIKAPVVYIFRVRPTTHSAGLDAWRQWARALKMRGDSVVVLDANRRAPSPESASSLREMPRAVHETPLNTPRNTTAAGRVRAAAVVSSGGSDRVRELVLAAGRIVSADPARLPMSSRDSGGA